MDDVAIHRVLNHADGNGDWLLCSIHSSPFHLHSSICCFPVDRRARKGLAMTRGGLVRLLWTSGSPRASPSR
jgi:hypothetical protein